MITKKKVIKLFIAVLVISVLTIVIMAMNNSNQELENCQRFESPNGQSHTSFCGIDSDTLSVVNNYTDGDCHIVTTETKGRFRICNKQIEIEGGK